VPHSTYLPERMGTAEISPIGKFEAGSFQSFTLVYTAGYFGIDDTGSIKIVHRFASDMGRPQWSDPQAANYTTVEASNGAVLDVLYDPKLNIRPWDKTLMIRVIRGFLREGDTITVRFGDPRQGSPGMRVQTFVEPSFEFRVLVDAFATCDYAELSVQPTISIVAGPPATWKAVLPTLRPVGERFRLGFKGEDKWGNPSDQVKGRFSLRANRPIRRLPAIFSMKRGEHAKSIEGLSVAEPGDLLVEVLDASGKVLCISNPLRIASFDMTEAPLRSYWCDLHGQSEETIGTNSARELIEFARDRAFLDGMSHQGNDFQITTPFWNELNELAREYNEDGSFIIFPGYEWSGNTGLGGDRNVLFMREGQQIHRSSHALVDDQADLLTDANSAEQLFDALKNQDCVVFAHIGGRYADIRLAHDARIERSVEVHSDWGTFEWLFRDALEQGYRVGILANSDGHKGRHGASHPGASLFGAYGGLSCLLADDLTRGGLADSLRRRHHYATTGCRMVLDVRAAFDAEAQLYADDSRLGPTTCTAMMGDILRSDDASVEFRVEALASAPIERLEIRNGLDVLETWRPYGEAALGRRIRVIWEGSEYRGRGRQTIWDGGCTLTGNAFERVAPINLWNLDKKVRQTGPATLAWEALTTGGFGGFDAWLADPRSGALRIDTPLVKSEIAIADIGLEDLAFEAGGIGRRIRVFRLPDENPHRRLLLSRRVPLKETGDNALYVCLTQEDGHLVWSSPIYVFR
jgi:uncharacterized protein DUF3604